ncbi:partitioning defective 3 homolog isoform X2 [Uranotaenia lowii]|uniref:partitioning defective 3 homolog isoform X2 n=1 Tax=Uranotaenia lowii TaxID=190385 RepID=UPI002478F608|nr:partitioning defective 3 homolog isoform X2 [Uranotaenia lowii]
MKVTVCFGSTRFVVPCPPGTTVRKLEQEAIIRYKRKNPESWVVVHHLQSQSGILDPDDHISDVADDREEILASYEDCPGGPDPGVPQGGGDGASGSSVGTGSPDIFRTDSGKFGPETSTPHIEVTSTAEPPMGLGLQVRRGSEPSLHQIGVTDQRSPLYNVSPNSHQDTKRWSAAPVCRSDSEPPERLLSPPNGVSYMSPEWNVLPEEESHDSLPPQQFSRSGRLSMQFLGAEAAVNGYRWMDAAERASANTSGFNGAGGLSTSANSSFNSKSLPRESTRKEPLGQANASVYESLREKDGEMLLVVNENGGPLGLTAIPDPDIGGLLVQSVEPGSRADRGRLRRGDRILEINNIKLVGLSESSVQEHLRKSLSSSELRLRVIRATTARNKRDNRVSQMIEAEEKPAGTKVATVSPTRKVPGAPSGISNLQAANTRKLGKRIEITLKKGINGLGFSVTTRDNQAGGQCPIYIKNILSKGAAVEDGRLKSGDRLLEVDDVPMTGKSQSEVVSILRATEFGATVRIVVSRQHELADVEEREIGCGVENEHKNTPPKPPPPVLPKSALKQTSRARSEEILDSHDGTNGGLYYQSKNVRSLVSKMSPPSSSVNQAYQHTNGGPPPVQKKPLTSILKSASTNQVSELFQDQQQQHVGGNAAGLGGSNSSSSGTVSGSGIQWKNREILTLHIPVHDTEKAGLGVSVKGKTGSGNSSSGSAGSGSKHDGDLGIFVKSVLHGGAASRDGRLKMNDQLLSVNGVSLLGQSNAEAMDTLRRAMLQTSGTSHPGKIVLTVARRVGRPMSTGELAHDPVDNSNSSEQSGATVIYLSPEKNQQQQPGSEKSSQHKRYSNPVLDRLTGGTGAGGSSQSLQSQSSANNGGSPTNTLNGHHNSAYHHQHQRPTPMQAGGAHQLRNESYYMATNDNWSPAGGINLNGSNAVLIEEDPEPTSPTFNLTRPMEGGAHSTSTPNGDVTYASQLSLDTNPPGLDAFSRDAIGRRSMSEKHHAALDARETGTYQRNKKLREERERQRKAGMSGAGSVESLTSGQMGRMNSLKAKSDLKAEALDRLGELGPSLGMKKSSSLESLQTMVQEIQMADEPRGPNALRTPRGRGREEILRAAVERPPESQAKKHWLLEDAAPEGDSGGFAPRGSPFQSSLNDGKHKNRPKKNGLFRGIGHMFRFGKHRKDGIAPISDNVPADYTAGGWNETSAGSSSSAQQKTQTLTVKSASSKNSQTIGGGPLPNGTSSGSKSRTGSIERSASAGVVLNHPPQYQPPPPPQGQQGHGHQNGGTSIHHTDVFNHRYSHYVNYEELQQQISNRLTLGSRSSSYGNLASSGGSSANHIYALISHNLNNNATTKSTGCYRTTTVSPNNPANQTAAVPAAVTVLASSRPRSISPPTTTVVRRVTPSPVPLASDIRPDLLQTTELLAAAGLLTSNNVHRRPRLVTPAPEAEENTNYHPRQLSSDYCRYVSRTLGPAPPTTDTIHQRRGTGSLFLQPELMDAGVPTIITTSSSYTINISGKSTTNTGNGASSSSSSSTSNSGPSSGPPVPVDSVLSESILEQMRQQVRRQREKVEEESRRHHHYHSQRSARNTPPVDLSSLQHHQQQLAQQQQLKLKQGRPVSSYYDGAGAPTYEIIQHNGLGGSQRKSSQPSSPSKQLQQQQQQQINGNSNSNNNWNGTISSTGSGGSGSTGGPPPGYHHQPPSGHGSIRSRGPFVTQVQIQNPLPYQ